MLCVLRLWIKDKIKDIKACGEMGITSSQGCEQFVQMEAI